MSKNLNPKKALIFRIIHRDNIPWIFDHGLHCKNSSTSDSQYVDIGSAELIDKRSSRIVECPPGGTLSDYVPFYFTPFSPMMYNIKTGRGVAKRGNDEIVILVSSLHKLSEMNVPFVFTDRHAYLKTAQFSADLARLDWIDWPRLQNRDFTRDDSDKNERYQAEALVHQCVPIDALLGIICYNDSVQSYLNDHAIRRDLSVEIAIRPRTWYFP